MTALHAIGLMSGTSMDGIDVAALETDGETVSATGPLLSVPYEATFRRRIEAALETAKTIVKRDERPGDLAALEQEITLRHADAVKKFLEAAEPEWRRPDVIGFHGQTVLHRPGQALTVQLGDGALLARETGITVVHDMRANDMEHGGQGAPLVPAYHAALARSLPREFAGDFPIVFVNIGGISNITYVPREGDPVAFDTGPGNTLIDQWVAREAGVPFDAGRRDRARGWRHQLGRRALSRQSVLQKIRPEISRPQRFHLGVGRWPRTIGRRAHIGSRVSRSNSKSVDHLPEQPKLWIVCGGGRKNPHIVGDVRAGAEKTGAKVIVAEDAKLNGDATEAEAWAYLAVRSMRGLPLTFPATTGCHEPVTGGILKKPEGAQ